MKHEHSMPSLITNNHKPDDYVTVFILNVYVNTDFYHDTITSVEDKKFTCIVYSQTTEQDFAFDEIENIISSHLRPFFTDVTRRQNILRESVCCYMLSIHAHITHSKT